MEKQAAGASWTTPVLLCTTHISGLLLSFRMYLSPLVSCTWDRHKTQRLGFLALAQVLLLCKEALEHSEKNLDACCCGGYH